LAAATVEQLVLAARSARERAYAPFSKFKVGAARRRCGGKIYTGCNVENATYGLTICAEKSGCVQSHFGGRVPIGPRAVVADTPELTPPCGACRQILWNFCGDAELILANLAGASERLRISQIFPRPFDKSFL